jgi:serine/threonine protein kinase
MEERYIIGKNLGAGSFGDVHLIIEKSTGNEVSGCDDGGGRV